MNPETAQDYRRLVLARGGTVEALDLVRDFLGREPNADAFLRELGLEE
jgi:Zn-dependent oligopeptidase